MKLEKGYFYSGDHYYKYWKLNDCICDRQLLIGNIEAVKTVIDIFYKSLNVKYNYDYAFGMYYLIQDSSDNRRSLFIRSDKQKVHDSIKNERFKNKFNELLND